MRRVVPSLVDVLPAVAARLACSPPLAPRPTPPPPAPADVQQDAGLGRPVAQEAAVRLSQHLLRLPRGSDEEADARLHVLLVPRGPGVAYGVGEDCVAAGTEVKVER